MRESFSSCDLRVTGVGSRGPHRGVVSSSTCSFGGEIGVCVVVPVIETSRGETGVEGKPSDAWWRL